MGGSGGYFTPRKSLDDLLKENLSKEEEASFNQDINAYINRLLVNINDRDIGQIQKHLDTLKGALEKEIEGTVELKFGGSVSKHTYANGLSDIDMLVGVSKSSLSNSKPEEVLRYFRDMIQKRLPNTEVKLGDLAVSVKFSSGYEIQLLPTIETKAGFRIAVPGKNEWSKVVRPKKFAEKLTDINRKNAGKVVPIIKLFKVVNNQLPHEIQLSGYHIESLAINFFKSYRGEKKYHTVLKEFTEFSRKSVLTPIKDSTGQSIHVDEYLGTEGSVLRRQVSKALERLSNRMKRADTLRSLDEWKKLIGN